MNSVDRLREEFPDVPEEAIRPYIGHRNNASQRGIGWEFDPSGWWAKWLESGKWAERGRGDGYCMARNGDKGPYAPWNVYICTSVQNVKDGAATRRGGAPPASKLSTDRVKKLRADRIAQGLVRGDVYAHPGDWPKIKALELALRESRARNRIAA